MTDAIHRLSPQGNDQPATDDQLAEWYEAPADAASWLRANFVSSLDGAATHEGRSGGLSGNADKRVFDILRRLCDVVVVGAGTIRDEGYSGLRVDAESAEWRQAHGFAPQPALAVVSARLDLDPASSVFTDAPVRALVLTGSAAPRERVEALAEVADVIECGVSRVDTALMRDRLAERGFTRVHSEGGPHLLGAMVEQGTLDELCLTLSPIMEGGTARRITDGGLTTPTSMRLAQVLASGDMLLLRYLRA